MHANATDWFTISAAAEGVYGAIGDVHGRADLLEAMLAKLDRDLPEKAALVLLGDLIDRGPESLRALDLAAAGVPGRIVVSLGGNHESMLLQAIDQGNPDEAFGAMWMWGRNGGDKVMDELGMHGANDTAVLRELLGQARIDYLESMLPHFRTGDVLFAHAGLDPRFPLGPQLEWPVKDFKMVMEGEENDSMRWVRQPWVGYDRPLEDGLFVVYGHTIHNKGIPLVTSVQAGIDLGAYSRGVLCAAEVDHDRMRFHCVGSHEAVERAMHFSAPR